MLKIKEAIVVEGRYDKIALEPLVDTAIFTTDGFGIFKNKEKLALLRRVAEQRAHRPHGRGWRGARHPQPSARAR